MSKTLGKLEKIVLFSGFVLVLAGLVAGSYLIANHTPQSAVAMEEIKPSSAPPLATVTDPPAGPTIVFESAELEPLTADDWSWQAWHSPAPVTEATGEKAVAAKPPEPRHEGPAAAPAIEIKLSPACVTHMFTGEESDGPCWYELKLDSTQIESLRAAVTKIAQSNGSEIDELDHLAEPPPIPAITLRWWRPTEIADVNLLCIPGEKSPKMWIAMSRRTGRAFMFADRPVQFSAS